MHNYVEVWGWLVWGRSVHFFDPFYSPYSFNFVVAAKQQIKRIQKLKLICKKLYNLDKLSNYRKS